MPLQVDTILELLGPGSHLEKITLKINDEKLKSFERMMNRLKYLKHVEIICPEHTQLLELSDLLNLGHVGQMHPRIRKLKIHAPRVNCFIKCADEQKFSEMRLTMIKGTLSPITFYQKEHGFII
jgi:hypothetical protein